MVRKIIYHPPIEVLKVSKQKSGKHDYEFLLFDNGKISVAFSTASDKVWVRRKDEYNTLIEASVETTLKMNLHDMLFPLISNDHVDGIINTISAMYFLCKQCLGHYTGTKLDGGYQFELFNADYLDAIKSMIMHIEEGTS